MPPHFNYAASMFVAAAAVRVLPKRRTQVSSGSGSADGLEASGEITLTPGRGHAAKDRMGYVCAESPRARSTRRRSKELGVARFHCSDH